MKKTFFNNSTKGNETQNQPSKSKRKIFKAFGFGSLAVMMAVAGTFAFAPLGAGAQGGALANASEIDQINTKADGENIKYAPSALGLEPENDPVIYTTESGLEIKFGGATAYTANGGGNETETISYADLSSGPLSGYPYFTMGTYNGYAVNWVIIGKSTTMPSGTKTNLSYDILTNWQTKTDESPTYKNFFEKTYEIVSPAGVAIKNNNLLNDYTARKLTKTYPTFSSKVISTSEISSGYILAISESVITTSNYANTTTDYSTSRLKTVMNNLYSTELSLTATQKNLILATTVYSRYYNGSSIITNDTAANQKMFPLAWWDSDEHDNDQNFLLKTYLKTNALKIAYTIGTTTPAIYWTRTGYSSVKNQVNLIGTNGGQVGGEYTITSILGVRPACVINIS